MLIGPSKDCRVEPHNQVLLVCGSIRTNLATHIFQEGVRVPLGRCNQELAVPLTQVLPQEVEALLDMRDADFLW